MCPCLIVARSFSRQTAATVLAFLNTRTCRSRELASFTLGLGAMLLDCWTGLGCVVLTGLGLGEGAGVGKCWRWLGWKNVFWKHCTKRPFLGDIIRYHYYHWQFDYKSEISRNKKVTRPYYDDRTWFILKWPRCVAFLRILCIMSSFNTKMAKMTYFQYFSIGLQPR